MTNSQKDVEARPARVAKEIRRGRERSRALRFAMRMYAPRIFGLALVFMCVASVFHQQQAHWAAWVALALNAFLWPHVAYAIAMRSRNPRRAEIRNLLVDSAAGGVWVALMHFNLLPSVLLVSMLSMDKISVGGLRLLAKSVAVQIAACAATALAFGFEVRLESTMPTIIASVPLLIAYPIVIGLMAHHLVTRVREQNRVLEKVSRADSLTGLLNRKNWQRAVSAELKRHRRGNRPVSLAMIDIDHFKQINDRYGHLAGDAAIRSVAEILRNSVREQDTVGRYGGEEFGILLPDTAIEGARVIAERIRQHVELAVLDVNGGIKCSVSIGVAEATVEVRSPRHWIERADKALYRAKGLGRNRVVLHGRIGDLPLEPPSDAAVLHDEEAPALRVIAGGR